MWLVWGWLHNLCNIQRIFSHLGVQLCSQPSHPFISIVIMLFYSLCKLLLSLCTILLAGIWCCDKSINLLYSFYTDKFVLSWSKIEHKAVAELYWNYWIHTPACNLIPLFLLCDNYVGIVQKPRAQMFYIWNKLLVNSYFLVFEVKYPFLSSYVTLVDQALTSQIASFHLAL